MNKAVLGLIADWMRDCLINYDEEKFAKLEKIYSKMFDRQWKYGK